MTTPSQPAVLAWAQRNALVVDALAAGGLWALLALPYARVQALAFLLSSGLTLPLVLRRRQPEAAFALVSVSALAQAALTDGPLASDVGFLVALYALAAHGRTGAVRVAGLGVGLLGAVLGPLTWSKANPGLWPTVLIGTVLVGACVAATWIAGDLVRRRRQVVASLELQNEALRRDRDQRDRLAVQAERARIAREMHDVVAHNLSVVVVQADGAAYAARLASRDPQERAAIATDALDTIGRTARAALAETRRLVGVLRETGEPGHPGEEAAYAPVAGLAEVPGLVDSVRVAGLPVTLERDPTLPPLPVDGDLAAYRVVQEALTNVLRHAGPAARVQVRIGAEDDGVAVEVVDDGRGAAAPDRGGSGLVGMRERVSAAGGTLTAGPRPGGGYAVLAHLPAARHAQRR